MRLRRMFAVVGHHGYGAMCQALAEGLNSNKHCACYYLDPLALVNCDILLSFLNIGARHQYQQRG